MYSGAKRHVSESVRKQAELSGEPIPDDLTEAPELNRGLELYYAAYHELDTQRSHGVCLTPIPWSSIAEYSLFHCFDEDQTENLFYYIKAMDRANLLRLQAEQKKKTRKPK